MLRLSSSLAPSSSRRAETSHPSDVRHASPGDVLVLKGAGQPFQRGAVQRSPPIEVSGAVRVVLTISTLEAP